MSVILADLRHGLRQLRRQPLFAAAAIGSLAIGIGLNTTLFSVVNAVLFRDNVVAAPDRLVEIYSGLSKDFPQLTTSYPDFKDIREGADATSGTVSISDGPYTETTEYLGGITIIDVPDLETAKMWAGRVAEGCGWPQEVRVIK